jgi:hypothetical protein
MALQENRALLFTITVRAFVAFATTMLCLANAVMNAGGLAFRNRLFDRFCGSGF